MNTLSLHIEYLLRHEDCVIIPSLGAFIVSRRPAYFDREAGVILPPSAEIMFNASITNNDGVLANSIARRLQIPYNEGLEMLMRIVNEMQDTLRERGELSFGRLGVLSMGAEGNKVYTPAQLQGAQSAARMGLYPLRLTSAAAVGDEISAEVGTDTQAYGRKLRSDKYYYIPVHKTFAKVAASLVAVVVVALAVLMARPNVDTPQHNTASVIPVADVAKPKPAPRPEAAPATVQNRDTVSKTTYHLVVGTFTTPEEVERFMRRNADKGFNLQAIKGKRYIRVSAANAADRDSLVVMMRSERVDTCFKDPWIWKE